MNEEYIDVDDLEDDLALGDIDSELAYLGKSIAVAQYGISPKPLSPRQNYLLDALMSRGANESLAEVAARAKVSIRSMYRYLKDPHFKESYKEAIECYLGAHRSHVAEALYLGAITPGRGQAAMQRLYWSKLGEGVTEKLDVNLENCDSILSQVLGVPVDQLPK